MPITMNELNGWAQNWCLPQGTCPPVVVQQGCCPVTGIPYGRTYGGLPRGRTSSGGGGNGGGNGGGGGDPIGIELRKKEETRRRLEEENRIQPPEPPPLIQTGGDSMISIDTPEGIALVSKTTSSQPVGKIGKAYTSGPVVAMPTQPGTPGGPTASTGLTMPSNAGGEYSKQFLPAGFVAPAATKVPLSPPVVATKAAQAPASANRFFPGGWQNAQTLKPSDKLDVLAIQNQNRKQVTASTPSTLATAAVPGAQGGYMQTTTANVAGLGSRDTDPTFLPRYAAGALGVYMTYCGLLKKRKKDYTKAALGAGLVYVAYQLSRRA
jgi:hypothetical protein